ncbi:MAG: type II toxin-antitoxin system VapC family toxin [Gammaproteobacteria bacterium]|nr:type II toxin-antitoxin system VapC family toxin [Gammaproteobacteria bacterium]
MNFWDTSALVALNLDEPHRPQALKILEADDRMAVWWGSPVEYAAALARREREGRLTAGEVVQHLSRLAALSKVWFEVRPSRRIVILAQRLLRVHPLRAADSLQLAAALTVAEDDPASIGFVCFDTRLNEAASREGLAIPPSAP